MLAAAKALDQATRLLITESKALLYVLFSRIIGIVFYFMQHR